MPLEIYGPDPTVFDTTGRKPHVLIIGAGLSGLALAILLQKADIPFDIFEKSSETRAIGSALLLTPQVLPVMTELGILDEYLQASSQCPSIQFFNQDRQPDFQFDFQLYQEYTGSDSRIISHTTLHSLLLSRVPSSRIHTSKRMLWFTQGENGVLIQFSDKKTFEGDILVGADGPNSAVRQCLFESLKKAKKLSRDDTKAFEREKEGLVGQGLSSNSRRRQSVTLIGQTNQLENSLFSSPGNERDNEVGNEEVSLFYNTRLNNHSFSWNVVTCGDDTINWTVTQYYAASPSSSIPSPQTIDWSSDGVAIESMCKHIYNLPIPSLQGDNVASFISKMPASNGDTNESIALTVGDLIDKTPREQMTKVVSEDQLYETWYYCRTVLIGDACHKLRPVANQGAYLALMDAYALFLNVSKLETTQLKHLTPALKAYKSTRLPASQRAWMLSKALSRINSSNESYTGTMARKILQKLPVWARRKVFEQFMFVDNVNQRKSRTTTEESQCTLSGCDTSSLGEISDFNSSLISLQPDVKEIEALVAAMNCEIEKGSTEELPSTMSSKASEKPNTTTI